MGKRELLLIVAFLIVGAVVYQATAPPPGPNDRRLSFSRFIDHVRREIRGNRANAQDTRASTHELAPNHTEVRVSGSYAELTITGEERTDVETRFRVTSTGYDEAEAKQLLSQTQLKVDRGGAALRLTSDYPRGGTQRAYLTLLVPRRMNVRVDQGGGKTTITNVANLEISGVRGETTLKKIPGRLTVAHRGGRLVVEDIGTLKMTGRGSEATVSNIRGDASFSLQGGEFTATAIAGSIDVESQGAEVAFTKLDEGSGGSLRVNATGGSVALEGLKGDARIDGRGTEIDIGMSKAAAVAVYNEGDERISITPPPGGFVLDALVSDGRLDVPDDLKGQLTLSNASDDNEQRANGPLRGGGPTITLRANHGGITIRARPGPKSDESLKPER